MNKVIDTSKFFYEADVKGSLLKIKKKSIKLVHATATAKIQTKTGQLMR